jgi:hypothetical protein
MTFSALVAHNFPYEASKRRKRKTDLKSVRKNGFSLCFQFLIVFVCEKI